MSPSPPHLTLVPNFRSGPVLMLGGGGWKAIFILIRGLRDGIWIPDGTQGGSGRIITAEKEPRIQSSEGLLGASYVTLCACICGERRTSVQPHLTVRLNCMSVLWQAIEYIQVLMQSTQMRNGTSDFGHYRPARQPR